jgi:hypothetical protein
MTVGLEQWPGKKQNLRRAPSVKFRLLTPIWNEMLRLARLKIILRKKKKRNNSSSCSCRPLQKLNHRLQQVADYKPGDRLKEHKYSSFCQSYKRWTMKLFFHLLDLTVLNSWIPLSSCGVKCTHRDFGFLLVKKLIKEAEKSQDCPNPRLIVRPSVGAKNVLLLERRHNKQWPVKSSTHMCCYLCASHGQSKAQCITAPDVMWACSRCLVSWNITPK